MRSLVARGFAVRVCANDFLLLYVARERTSLGLFILASLQRNSAFGVERGLKYFVTRAFGSGCLLLGMGSRYGGSGSIQLQEIEEFCMLGW